MGATGHATLTVASLAAGNHTIVASYGGDNNDFSSVSPELTQGVLLRATTTALAISEIDPANPQQVTLIGIVGWTGPVPPTGTITFTNGSAVIGSSPIDTSGAATINITLDANITENVVATYNGDMSYASSASLATSVTGGPGDAVHPGPQSFERIHSKQAAHSYPGVGRIHQRIHRYAALRLSRPALRRYLHLQQRTDQSRQ